MLKCEKCIHKKICIDGANYKNAEACRNFVNENDVGPVVHAHWIKTGGYVCGDHEYICSRCNETYWEGDNFAKRAQWCLSCGAKMDGGETNGINR